MLRTAIRENPETRLAVMFHEDFVPAINWKFAIMRQWQRWQFKKLGRAAHLVFFSIDPWVKRYSSWFPGKPVLHLPVGSNIPLIEISNREARRRLGITDGKLVLGLFGARKSDAKCSIIPRSRRPGGSREWNRRCFLVCRSAGRERASGGR